MKKNIFGNFIPTITMLVIAIISYFFRFKDLLIVGIVGIIPISFFIEGVMCSRKKIGWIIPLILSLTVFFIIDKIMLFMNDSPTQWLKQRTKSLATWSVSPTRRSSEANFLLTKTYILMNIYLIHKFWYDI